MEGGIAKSYALLYVLVGTVPSVIEVEPFFQLRREGASFGYNFSFIMRKYAFVYDRAIILQ